MNNRTTPKTAFVTKPVCHMRKHFNSENFCVTERDKPTVSHDTDRKQLKPRANTNARGSVTKRDNRKKSHGVRVTTNPHP